MANPLPELLFEPTLRSLHLISFGHLSANLISDSSYFVQDALLEVSKALSTS